MSEKPEHCALYIDYGSLVTRLNRQRIFHIPITDMVEAFKEEAKQYGQLAAIHVFADWTRYDGANLFQQSGVVAKFTPFGHRNAHSEISKEINTLLNTNGTIDTFILVANDKDYEFITQRLRNLGHQVVLWGIKQFVKSNLINAVDKFTPIEDILRLELEKPPLKIPRHFMLTALIIILDNQMATLESYQIPQGLCIERLNSLAHFDSNGQMWLNQAIEENLVAEVSDPYYQDNSLCFLNDKHPKVQLALDTRDRLLLAMDSALHGKRWIAFNTLEQSLRSHRVFGANEAKRRLWIELLISENLILAEKYNNPNKPHLPPTTALMLNQDHPVMQEIPQLVNNQLQRLIITVENFLLSRGYQWIAASTLLRLLENYLTQASAQSVLSFASDEGIILIEKLESASHSGRSVSTVRLNEKNKLVQNTLKQRNRAVRIVAATLLTRKSGLSHSILISSLEAEHFGYSDTYRRFWLDVLIRTEVLKRSKTSKGLGGGSIYYLNKLHPVVFMVLKGDQ
ncbi:MAG: NYN domain-containing protein [Anaerolineae bacterium]|nr:NYN domain-containing protein [Anaerolineae bacterium]